MQEVPENEENLLSGDVFAMLAAMQAKKTKEDLQSESGFGFTEAEKRDLRRKKENLLRGTSRL